MIAQAEETKTTEKRGDDEIWEEWALIAERLSRILKEAQTLTRVVIRAVETRSDMDVPAFRDVERKIYEAYRTVGDMSALIDEANPYE